MKINSSVALTLILLTLMFGAGFVCAAYGFTLGKEALKGITQPDVRPTNNLASRQGSVLRREEVVILREEDILRRVKAQIGSSTDTTDGDEKPSPSKLTPDEDTKTPASPKSSAVQAGLPIITQDRGVTLEVRSVSQQGGSLMLTVNLRNDGDRPVRFLYSFLNVTDDRGRTLSATTEGLPGDLPPRSQPYAGTVSIPAALLDDASKLSLTLTDFPDQQLQLKMSGIPVVK